MPIDRWKTAGQKLILSLFAIAAIMLPSMPGMAETTERVELEMVMYVAGLKAGTVRLNVDFNDLDAVTSLRLKSKGMVKMMTGYKGRSEARSALPDQAWPVPISYDWSYRTNKHDRKVEIRYSRDDGEIIDLNEWKRGEPRTTNVPEALQQATIDPLTAILHVRHWILALRADPSMAERHAFEVFDGRRRYRLNASVIEHDDIKFGGKKLSAYRLKVILDPLSGFRANDMLANWSSEGSDRWIELVITDDDNPMPLMLETIGGTLKTSIYLERACDLDGNCVDFDG